MNGETVDKRQKEIRIWGHTDELGLSGMNVYDRFKAAQIYSFKDLSLYTEEEIRDLMNRPGSLINRDTAIENITEMLKKRGLKLKRPSVSKKANFQSSIL